MQHAHLLTHSQQLIPMSHSYLSAGPALEITEDHHYVDVAALVTSGREGFIAYEVTGDSMMSCIQSGSIVFVDTYAQPRNGSIVAAYINGAVCIKEFQVKERRLYLVPRNDSFQTREVKDVDELHILGVVKGSLNFHG